MKIELIRVAHTEDGTFGVLKADGIPFAVTVERKWAENQRGLSCIPSGVYHAVRCRDSAEYGHTDSPKFGDTFVIEDVTGRSNILIHKGNIDDDTHGCVIIGEEFGLLNGKPAVLSSSKGFANLKALTIDRNINEFELTVRSA